MTDTGTPSPSSSSSSGATSSTLSSSIETERERGYEKLVAGHLALQLVASQLDAQLANLRAQLAVATSQRERTEHLLIRAEEKLAREHPTVHAVLTAEMVPAPATPARATRASARSRRSR